LDYKSKWILGFKGVAELIVWAAQARGEENLKSHLIERFHPDGNRVLGRLQKYYSFLLWPSARVRKVDRHS
jgi:hypothetical protein